jgi:hypothetical protein
LDAGCVGGELELARADERQPRPSTGAIAGFLVGRPAIRGATSALFSVVYPVLLAPPPYPDPDRLVLLSERTEDGENAGIRRPSRKRVTW